MKLSAGSKDVKGDRSGSFSVKRMTIQRGNTSVMGTFAPGTGAILGVPI